MENKERTEHYELVLCVLDALHNKVCQILLYGPAALWEPSESSEIDIAVLTPYKISADEEERLSTAVFELNQKHSGKYAVVDIDQAVFEAKRRSLPFYQKIDRTGIVLWPKQPTVQDR